MSHTPGPWHVLTLDDGTEWIQSGCVRVAIVDDSAGCQPGNAALLAAAPKMLEALTKAEDMINRSVSGMAKYNVLDWTGLLVQMQSAIKKARGGE